MELFIRDRAYYEEKKKEFANELINWHDTTSTLKMGDNYGYTLPLAMELSTIEKYEALYDVRLPENLRKYLLTISSETIGSYSYNVENIKI